MLLSNLYAASALSSRRPTALGPLIGIDFSATPIAENVYIVAPSFGLPAAENKTEFRLRNQTTRSYDVPKTDVTDTKNLLSALNFGVRPENRADFPCCDLCA
jgi:hypothetical protein